MGKKELRQGIFLITYTCVLILILIYFKEILSGIGRVLELLNVFFLGIMFAFILNRGFEKISGWYRKLHIKEKYVKYAALVSVYVLLFVIIAGLIRIVLPQLADNVRLFVMNLDTYKTGIQSGLNDVSELLHIGELDVSNVFKFLEQYMGKFNDILNELLPHITTTTISVVTGIANICVGIGFSVYLLLGKDKILTQTKRLLKAVLPEKVFSVFSYIFKVVVETFNNYIIGQGLEAVILGSLCFVGMVILRLDYAGLISVVIAVTALIPILGAYLGGAVAVFLLFMVSPKKALIFIIFLVVLQQIEGNFIYPRVVGKKIGLPGIWVLLGITVGGKAGGIPGMLFGVPILSSIYTLLKQVVLILEERKKDTRLERTN